LLSILATPSKTKILYLRSSGYPLSDNSIINSNKVSILLIKLENFWESS
jgi:hypothetical protein